MPELLLKTITQQEIKLEVEDTATVGEVKKKIEETKGKEAFPVEGQKLIFNGKVLDDNALIKELNVIPPKFIVVMVMRKAPPKTSTNTSGQGSSSANPSAKTETSAGEKKEGKEPTPAEARGDKSKTEVPEEHAQTVANIESMGYPRDEVVRALQAAFFNADRAVEYLCNGIPEGLSLQPSGGNAAAGEDEAATQGEEEGEEEGGDDLEGLAFLAQSPQFQQLRDMVRADPSALPQIVQQIAATNPELMGLIANHQAEFLQLLNTDAEGGGAGGGGGGNANVAVGGAGVAQGGAAQGGQRRIAIPVTQEDREAINRLNSMGFPEALVIEAYFACDKNEDLAVNYILSRMEEFQAEVADEPQQQG